MPWVAYYTHKKPRTQHTHGARTRHEHGHNRHVRTGAARHSLRKTVSALTTHSPHTHNARTLAISTRTTRTHGDGAGIASCRLSLYLHLDLHCSVVARVVLVLFRRPRAARRGRLRACALRAYRCGRERDEVMWMWGVCER